MDPDQTSPTGAVWSGSTLFFYEASNILVDDKNIYFVIMVNKCEFSVYTVRILEMHARFRGPKSLLTLYQIIMWHFDICSL